MLDLFQYLGAATGIAGAFLLALHRPYSHLGWWGFLISNACWIGYSLMAPAYGLLMQQIVFTATSILGIWRARALRRQ